MTTTRWVEIPLKGPEEGLWFGRLDATGVPPGAQLWLGVRSARAEVGDEVQKLARVSSWRHVGRAVQTDDPGAKLMTPTAFDEPPPDASTTWFRIDHWGEHWNEVEHERAIAVYLPELYSDGSATLLLYADGERIIGSMSTGAYHWGPVLA